MALFLDVHSDAVGITKEQLEREHEKDLQLLESEKDVRFLKAWADPKAGKIFCLSEGPSKEAVQRVHQKAGHPTAEIYELSFSVE